MFRKQEKPIQEKEKKRQYLQENRRVVR